MSSKERNFRKHKRDDKEKKFTTCSEALDFIDKLLEKKNTTGRLHSKQQGTKLIWDWSVIYKEKGKE